MKGDAGRLKEGRGREGGNQKATHSYTALPLLPPLSVGHPPLAPSPIPLRCSVTDDERPSFLRLVRHDGGGTVLLSGASIRIGVMGGAMAKAWEASVVSWWMTNVRRPVRARARRPTAIYPRQSASTKRPNLARQCHLANSSHWVFDSPPCRSPRRWGAVWVGVAMRLGRRW